MFGLADMAGWNIEVESFKVESFKVESFKVEGFKVVVGFDIWDDKKLQWHLGRYFRPNLT